MHAVPDPSATVAALVGITGRGPCTDAERRAAGWLHDRLRDAGHEAWVETHWVRPQWPASLLLGSALAVAGAVLSITAPVAGLIAAALAAFSLALDAAGRPGPLRLLMGARATQNVLVVPPDERRIAVLVTARYDAPRTGLVFAEGFRRIAAGLPLGPRAWVAGAAAVVALTAAARATGSDGVGIGAAQFLAAVVLVLAVAAAADIALSEHGPGAGDNAAGVAAALELFDALTRQPLARLSPGLVLAGAGEGGPLGLRAQVRADDLRPHDTVLVELGPCGAGTVHWWTTQDQLTAAASGSAARSRRRRGAGAIRRIPTLWVGALEHGIAPRARGTDDTGADPAVVHAAARAAHAAVVRLDAQLADRHDERREPAAA